jgi:hypothetical protein
VQLKPIIMAVRRKLVSELRTTGSLLLNASAQHRDATAAADAVGTDVEGVSEAKPYRAVPGPRELPLIGNAWRFLPYIGKQLLGSEHLLSACPVIRQVGLGDMPIRKGDMIQKPKLRPQQAVEACRVVRS